MPLQRIRASALQPPPDPDRSGLAAEAVRLPEGRTLLDRRAEADSVLIVVEGRMRIGVLDDDALLDPGEGVLLGAGDAYSIRSEADSVAFVFSAAPPPGPA